MEHHRRLAAISTILLILSLTATGTSVGMTDKNDMQFNGSRTASGLSNEVTKISDCRDISSSGHYQLTRDIINTTEHICISINASNVVLDGAGHRIDGVDKFRFDNGNAETMAVKVLGPDEYVNRPSNVTVKNLVTSDFGYGIFLRKATHSQIINNTARSNGIYGIYVGYDGNHNRFANNHILNTSNDLPDTHAQGIVVERSDGNEVVSNVVKNNENVGIIPGYADDTLIANNSVIGNNPGVDLHHNNDTIIRNNTILNNRDYGILLRGGIGDKPNADNKNVSIIDNQVTGHKDSNILIEGNNTEVQISNNTVTLSEDQGIRLLRNSGNAIKDNTVTGNRIGVSLVETGSNTITDNSIRENEIGIQLEGGENISIRRNTVAHNSVGGLLVFGNKTAMTTGVHENRIVGNTEYGVKNHPNVQLNATYNYWGASDGPDRDFVGSGDRVIGNATVRPFYKDTDMTTLSAEQPPPIGVNPPSPNDLNGDGKFEDINGDGSFSIVDVQTFFLNRNSDAIQNNAKFYDFSGDGSVGIVDVQKLFVEVTR